MISYSNRLEQLSACLVALSRSQEIEELSKKHTNSEDEGTLRYYLGLAYARQGKIDEALKELRIVLEKRADHELARNLACKLLIHEAGLKIKEKDWKGISSALTQALELAPDTPDAQKELLRFKNALPISYIKAGKREEWAKIL